MRPKIAVPIPARTVNEASRMVRKARRLGADLAEIRLDYLNRNEPIEKLAKIEPSPLIATFLSSRNRGARRTKEAKRIEALIAAAEAGFSYVDVEIETRNLRSVIDKLRKAGAKTIASHHDFTGTASHHELRKALQLCRGSCATLCKLVTMVRSLEDNLRLLALTREASRKSGLICFGMGELGIQSRLLSPIYGAAFTFASLDERTAVAPGQIPVSRMRRIYAEMGYQ